MISHRAVSLLPRRFSSQIIRNGFYSTVSTSSSTPTPIPSPIPTPTSSRSTKVKNPLPSVPNQKPIFLLAGVIAITSWSLFTLYATNKERLSSSVFRSVVSQIKSNVKVIQTLGGDPILLSPSYMGLGDPWISGSVNMMQGKVDISFKLKGPKDSATVYFTCIRRDQQKHFEVLRFLIVTQSKGDCISLLSPTSSTFSST